MMILDVTEVALYNIKNLIVTHKYKPGDRLLETVLAKDLNLSRTPIRDALSRLESLGFLEKQKGCKGYSIPILTPEDMKKVFRIRIMLEGYATRMAVRNCTSENVMYLRELNSQEIEAFHGNRKEEYSRVNQFFHFTITDIADDKYVLRFIEQVFWRSELYDFFFAGFYNFDKSVIRDIETHRRISYEEHGHIIDEMEKGNDLEAEKVMQNHIRKAYFHLLNRNSCDTGDI